MNVHPISATADSELLHEAFRSFDDAAATLQQSYQTLTSRLEQLDVELADRNEALSLNLRANEELREHLTAIVESLSTGLLVMDTDGLITRCNQAGEQFLGLKRGQIIGRSLTACLKEAELDVKGLKPARVKDLSTGGVLFTSVKKMTVNEVLQMKLKFVRTGKPVEMAAIARVARCHKAKAGYHVGVEFLQVYSEDLQILESFIGRKSKAKKPV